MGTAPADRSEAATLVVAFAGTLLFAGALRGFFSAVYYHNLTSLGLNATALYALLLAAPFLYFLPVRALGSRSAFFGLSGVLVAARVAMGFAAGSSSYLPLAGLACAAYLMLLPHIISGPARHAGALAALGVALGWALDAALLVATRSADPLALREGAAPVAVLGILLFLVALGWKEVAPVTTRSVPRRGAAVLAGVGFGAWLFLEHAAFASPWTLARWNGIPIAPLAAGTVVGLVAAGALALRGRALSRGVLFALNALALAAVLDHALVHSPALPLLVAVAQVALVLDLFVIFRTLDPLGVRAAGRALAWGSFAALLLHFGFAFSFTFAYVPLSGIWHGAERWLFLLALGLVAAGALMSLGSRLEVPRAPRRVIALLLLVPLLTAPSGLFDPAAPVEAPVPGPLRVAAFNVHQGFTNDGVVDAAVFVDVLRELNADIVGLQESDTLRFTSANLDVVTILAHELGYHSYSGQPTREQSVGLAFLSRLRILEASWHRLPTTTDNRFFLEARLDAGGRDLWVYGVHMGLERPDRVDQVDALLARAALHSPRLLIGDFNSCPEGLCPDFDGAPDDVYSRVLAAGHVDAWVAAGHNATAAEGWTFETVAPMERIDYVFASPDIRVLSAQRVRSDAVLRASDHMPVLAVVELASAG